MSPLSRSLRKPPPQAPLSPEAIPFPVEAEYRIRPDLRRLEEGERHFLLDDAWPRYLARKLELLESDPQRCRVMAGDESAVKRGLWRVAELIAAEHPSRFPLDAHGLGIEPLGLRISRDGEVEPLDRAAAELRGRVLRHLQRLPPTERLADALALALQEDLVLLAGPPGGDRVQLLHVCFPSHWNPGERRAASFAELHAPVPHNDRLLAGSRNLVAAMLSKGPFIRHVWSLTASGDLDQNPERNRSKPPESGSEDPVDRLYFRAERQTTHALAEGTAGGQALFTIRIYVAPLRTVVTPERATLLALAIRSMDSELLRYKGLVEIRLPLLASLDRIAGGGVTG